VVQSLQEWYNIEVVRYWSGTKSWSSAGHRQPNSNCRNL